MKWNVTFRFPLKCDDGVNLERIYSESCVESFIKQISTTNGLEILDIKKDDREVLVECALESAETILIDSLGYTDLDSLNIGECHSLEVEV